MDNIILLGDIKLLNMTDSKIAFTPIDNISWFTIIWDMKNIEHLDLLLLIDTYLESGDIINACRMLMNIKTLKEYFIKNIDKKICLSFNFLKNTGDIEYVLFIPIVKNGDLYLNIDINYSKVFEQILDSSNGTKPKNNKDIEFTTETVIPNFKYDEFIETEVRLKIKDK